jgi:hypothetical protein
MSAQYARSAVDDDVITEGVAAAGSADALVLADGLSGDPVAAQAGPRIAAATSAIAICRTFKAP